MIQITITQAFVLYSLVIVVGAVVIGLFTELGVQRSYRVLGKQFLWRCTYCGYSYLDDFNDQLSQCPRCNSFNSFEDAREVKPTALEIAEEPSHDAAKRRNSSHRKRPHQRRRGPRKH